MNAKCNLLHCCSHWFFNSICFSQQSLEKAIVLACLTLWHPLVFGDFRKKTRLNTHGFAREFLQSSMLYRPSKSLKRRGKSFFPWGVRFFCEWRHKWRTFRQPWPTLPGLGRQLLDGSISLKFLLETRLQSKSFDTLDDLLGFRVQNLWCKLVKVFD